MDRQCSSCGGFCKKSGCERENVKPEQEPVAVWELQEGGWDTIADADWMETLPIGTKLYTAPQKKEWVGLTDKEVEEAGKLNIEGKRMLPYSFARAIEAKLREKNGMD